MKTMTKILLAVSAIIALCAMGWWITAKEFDWHLTFIRERPMLFLIPFLRNFFAVSVGGLIGLLVVTALDSLERKIRIRRLLFAIIILVIWIGTLFLFPDILSFDRKCKEKVAAIECRKAAEQGDADAQYKLGKRYEDGNGVESNEVAAVKWYRKAAEQGDATAQYELGRRYATGKGVETNKAEAAKWTRKAAEQGHVDAQYFTGMNYKFGNGVVQDNDEAEKWFGKIKNPIDQYYIGNMLFVVAHLDLAQNKTDIIYTAQDKTEVKAEAVKWYRKAAEQGHEGAKKALTEINKQEGIGQK